jgi:deferrochelatase/peroxidase EfeB
MSGCPFKNLSRRGFLKAVGGLGIVTAGAVGGGLATHLIGGETASLASGQHRNQTEPFYGAHQSGIITPQQGYTYFAALDLTTTKRDDIIAMLKAWTTASERMTRGQTAMPLGNDLTKPATDSGEALDLPVARLTLTFGFGAGLFSKNGVDRYNLAAKRPEALVDLPRFNGDQLVEEKTGGDISVQACGDDQQVVFHAVRQLVRLAENVATLRWTQSGFLSTPNNSETPRNLMGFKDGTQNPKDRERDKVVWADGPDWMAGGSYVVARRIRIALEHWDYTETDFQEKVIGRHKYSGAPLGMKNEFDALDLATNDKDGNPVIPENAHVRLASAEENDGAQILRRGYSYNDGVNFVAERWPPWRQGLEYDAGLFFVAYQNDPRTGFIKIFDKMSKFDALNQFVTHVGGGLFACPGGVREGEFIGQRLFAA